MSHDARSAVHHVFLIVFAPRPPILIVETQVFEFNALKANL
jgi:hypothetical protein